MKLEVIKINSNLMYRDRQSACLHMLCSHHYPFSPLLLSLIVKNTVGFIDDSSPTTSDAQWVKPDGEAETLVHHHVCSFPVIGRRQWTDYFTNSRLSFGWESANCLLSITWGADTFVIWRHVGILKSVLDTLYELLNCTWIILLNKCIVKFIFVSFTLFLF